MTGPTEEDMEILWSRYVLDKQGAYEGRIPRGEFKAARDILRAGYREFLDPHTELDLPEQDYPDSVVLQEVDADSIPGLHNRLNYSPGDGPVFIPVADDMSFRDKITSFLEDTEGKMEMNPEYIVGVDFSAAPFAEALSLLYPSAELISINASSRRHDSREDIEFLSDFDVSSLKGEKIVVVEDFYYEGSTLTWVIDEITSSGDPEELNVVAFHNETRTADLDPNYAVDNSPTRKVKFWENGLDVDFRRNLL